MSSSSNSNLPPADYLAVTLEAERLAVWVDAQLSEFDARCAALLVGYATFESKTTNGIQDEDIAERATLLHAQIHKQLSAVEAAREAIKAPVLAAARMIDGAARGRTAPLSAARAVVDQRAAVYMAARVEAERTRREAEAAALEAIAIEAYSNGSESQEAQEKLEAAHAAAQAAQVSDADLSRVRSAYGTQGSVKTSFDIRVLNVDDVPERWLKPREVDERRTVAAKMAAHKAGKPFEIPGIVFVPKYGVTMRG